MRQNVLRCVLQQVSWPSDQGNMQQFPFHTTTMENQNSDEYLYSDLRIM